jgi:hypothetical protein
MDPFALIVLIVIGGGLFLALIAGAAHKDVGSRMSRHRARRDPIAEGAVKRKDIDRSLEAENRRRGSRGWRPWRRAEFESLVVASPRMRRKVVFWKGRR